MPLLREKSGLMDPSRTPSSHPMAATPAASPRASIATSAPPSEPPSAATAYAAAEAITLARHGQIAITGSAPSRRSAIPASTPPKRTSTASSSTTRCRCTPPVASLCSIPIRAAPPATANPSPASPIGRRRCRRLIPRHQLVHPDRFSRHRPADDPLDEVHALGKPKAVHRPFAALLRRQGENTHHAHHRRRGLAHPHRSERRVLLRPQGPQNRYRHGAHSARTPRHPRRLLGWPVTSSRYGFGSVRSRFN